MVAKDIQWTFKVKDYCEPIMNETPKIVSQTSNNTNLLVVGATNHNQSSGIIVQISKLSDLGSPPLDVGAPCLQELYVVGCMQTVPFHLTINLQKTACKPHW